MLDYGFHKNQSEYASKIAKKMESNRKARKVAVSETTSNLIKPKGQSCSI